MPDFFSTEFQLAAAIAAAGGLMRGFTGFGSNLVMAPLFALLFGPVAAVMLAMTLDIVGAAALLPGAVKLVRWHEMMAISAAAFVTIPIGGWLLLTVDAEIMRRVIAAIVILSALALVPRWRFRLRRGVAGQIAAGAVSGVVGGASSMGGPPIVLYMLAGDAPVAETRAAMHVYSVIFLAAAITAFVVSGAMDATVPLRAASLLPFLLVCAWLGSLAFARVGDQGYRRAALWSLVVMGAVVMIL